MGCIHQSSRAAVVRMRVLHSAIIIDVQAAIRMVVVVIGILAMHDHVFNITRSLRDGCQAKRHCRLQKQGSQENIGEKTERH